MHSINYSLTEDYLSSIFVSKTISLCQDHQKWVKNILPKSALDKTMSYTYMYILPKLKCYTKRGDLLLNSNGVKKTIKSIALAIKNLHLSNAASIAMQISGNSLQMYSLIYLISFKKKIYIVYFLQFQTVKRRI